MKAFKTLATAATLLIGAASAQAALVDRGGGMIYDTELKITWLQDWNYAKTSGYDSDGRMNWSQAKTWANDLAYGGFDDWRLPTMVDTGEAGCDFSTAGGTDCGFSVQTKRRGTVYSEMAHLYYETLGNKPRCPQNGDPCGSQAGWGPTNTGPFSNMQSRFYWTGLEYATRSDWAWYFNIGDGNQDGTYRTFTGYVVAVRPGDVAATVPEPQTLTLVMMAFGAALFARRKRPL